MLLWRNFKCCFGATPNAVLATEIPLDAPICRFCVACKLGVMHIPYRNARNCEHAKRHRIRILPGEGLRSRELLIAVVMLSLVSWFGGSCSSDEPAEESDASNGGVSDGGVSDGGVSDGGTLGVVRVLPGEAVQVRSLNVLSGETAFLGWGNHRAVELAVEDYGDIRVEDGSGSGSAGAGPADRISDDYGGIGAFPVELGSAVDGLCSADGGRAGAQTIVADGRVVGVVGSSCSVAGAAAAPVITAAGMVMVAPSNTSPSLTSDLAGNPGEDRFPGYFRTSYNSLFQVWAIAEFLYNEVGFRTAATIHADDPAAQSFAATFTEAFEALGGSAGSGRISEDGTDIVPVLTELAAGEPEALLLPVFRPAGDIIAERARSVPGLESARMIAPPSLGDDFMKLPQSQGMFFLVPDPRLGDNINQATGKSAAEALGDYTDRYGEEPSSPFWAHAYDATTLLLDAISSSSTVDEDGALLIDRSRVRRTLHNTSGYRGLTGTLSCDEFGDCGIPRLIIIEHLNPADPEASKQNIVFEYTP